MQNAAMHRSAPAPAVSGSRLAGVEGLRGLAATSILVYHCWRYGTPGGARVDLGLLSRFALPHLPVGVTLFFTLSGFLLYRPLAAAALRDSSGPGLRAYLRNRALRILPAYWVILLVTAVLIPAALVQRSGGTVELGRLVQHPGVLLANLMLTQNYIPGALDTGIGPAWSLAVELVFYLVLPGLGWLAAACARRTPTRSRRTWAALVPAVLLMLVGLAGKALATFVVPSSNGYWYAMLVRSFLYHADLFGFGMVLGVLRVNLEDGELRLPAWWRRMTVAALGLVALAIALLADRGLLPAWGVLNPYQRLTSLACALLLALVVLPGPEPARPSPLVRLLETRLFVAAGLASYSLFLWHEPVVRWLEGHRLTVGGASGFWINLVLLGVVAGGLSALTYRYVERPALSRKARSRAARGPSGSDQGAATPSAEAKGQPAPPAQAGQTAGVPFTTATGVASRPLAPTIPGRPPSRADAAERLAAEGNRATGP
jgi:peptidoglycan/LPS O-acetylase OafA/YrhL